jgi:hypothetical protein
MDRRMIVKLNLQQRAMLDAYLEAIDFTAVIDEDCERTLTDEMVQRAEADCVSFYWRVDCYVDAEEGRHHGDFAQLGHDFWLTRNGHGAGFWDGDWPTYGDMFDKIAIGYGEIDAEWDEE